MSIFFSILADVWRERPFNVWWCKGHLHRVFGPKPFCSICDKHRTNGIYSVGIWNMRYGFDEKTALKVR